MAKTGREFISPIREYGVLQFPGEPRRRFIHGKGERHMEGIVNSDSNEFTLTNLKHSFNPDEAIEGDYTVVDVMSPDRALVRLPINIPLQFFPRKGRR